MTAADEPRPTTDTTGDPGITEAPAITEVPGDAEAPGIAEPPGRAERAWQGFLRGWRAFRRWRRGRPFWGGLITIIAGLEYYFSVHLDPTSISVSFGQQGFLAWLIPLVLVLCGLLGWFTPAQRIFYGIVAAGTAVYGLIAVNIGGFFLGMLIGILGGSLIAAWFPARRPPVAATPGAAADTDPSAAAAGLDADTANLPRVEDEVPAGPGSARHAVVPTEEGPRSRVRWRHRGGRGAALVLVPLAVLAIGVGAVQRAVPAYAAPSTCGSAEPVAPAGTPTSAATAPTTPATSPSPAATGGGGGGVIGGILGAIGDALDKLLGGDDPAPSASPSPAPSSATPSTPAAHPSTTKPAPKPTATCKPTGPAKPGPSASASAAPANATILAVPGGIPTVAGPTALLKVGKLAMHDLSYQGVVAFDAGNGKTVQALHFSMSSADQVPFELDVPIGSSDQVVQTSTSLTISGNVEFYCTSFSGVLNVLGIPTLRLTFTPDVPPPITLPEMTFTDVQIALLFARGDKLTAKDFGNSYRT